MSEVDRAVSKLIHGQPARLAVFAVTEVKG